MFHRWNQSEKFKKPIDSLGKNLWSPHEAMKIKVVLMSSNFERLQKIINQAYAENFSCLFHVNPEICQDAPNQGQDDLVLFNVKKPKW